MGLVEGPVVDDTWWSEAGAFADWILRSGWAQVLESWQVESGQPHSSCLAKAAALAARCFSISCPTIASTVSVV